MTLTRSIQEVAEGIFANRMRFEFTEDYEGSREWSDAVAEATDWADEPFDRTDEGAPICPHCGGESETDEFEAHICWAAPTPSSSRTDS